MLVKIEARILIFPGTDFHFPSTSVPPGTFFRLWREVPLFWRYWISLKHNAGLVERSLHAKNQLGPSRHFNRTSACDRHKHRHTPCHGCTRGSLESCWHRNEGIGLLPGGTMSQSLDFENFAINKVRRSWQTSRNSLYMLPAVVTRSSSDSRRVRSRSGCNSKY